MQKRMYTMLIATLTMGIVFTGCGNSKETNNDVNGTEISQIAGETEIIEVVEDATVTEGEDGSIIVETDTGEQVVIDDNAKVTENEDGSKTYETEDGTKIDVSADGETTVTTEEKVPVDTQTPPASNTEEAHSHSYTANVTKEATCTEKGEKTFTCSCGSSYTKEVDMLSHTTGDWEVTKGATCTEDGTKVKKCSVCGTQTESAEITKTGHTPGDWIVTKEATCSTNGSKHKVCSVCGVETETATITANGTHNYSWSTNGDTRTMKCACGATGITEYKYGNVWGYFDDAAAEELWGLINNLRNNTWYGFRDPMGNHISSYVSSLNKNNDLFTKAKRRAAEVALDYSHNGEQHECLAAGVPTAHEAKDDWVNSDTHCKALTDPDYTIGGVACFWYDSAGDGNCYPIWVFELGY